MRAVVRTEYGPPEVIRIAEVPKPVPSDDRVLIRVVAASINGSDREAVIGKPAYARSGGLRRPRNPILGSDIAGRVHQVGRNVRNFREGDEVLGEVPGYHSGFAEYVCIREKHIVHKPDHLTFAEAATIPQAGAIAVQAIRIKGRVGPTQKVLINGAGGAAGSFALQLAKLDGAEVTAVDHGSKAEFLRSLGADHVIDYTRTDFTKNAEHYDLILDPIAHRSVFACARALQLNGTYYVAGGSTRVLLAALAVGPWIRMTSGKTVRVLVVPQNQQLLAQATALCAERKMVPAIDRIYPFSEARDAMRYVIEGNQQGKVVISFDESA